MLLVRRSGETAWHSPKVTAYSDESALQTLVGQSPDLLPGANGAMAVVTEIPVSGIGYADIVGVDAAGTITLVECKLKANPEIRRQVVGQIVAYAAGLSGLSYEAFDTLFASKSGAPLAERVAALKPEGWDEEAFRVQVAENLTSGRFRLVIAVDEITDELKAVVRYLNAHTVPELEFLALELHYVADDGFEILVPTTYGEEGAQGKVPGGTKHKWDEQSVLSALETCCKPEGYEATKALYGFAKQVGVGVKFGGGPLASATARLPIGGKPVSVLSFYEWPQGRGVVAVNFEYLVGCANTAVLRRLADRLRQIPGASQYLQGLEQAEFKRRPGLPIDTILTKHGAVETIRDAIDELLAAPLA